MEFLATQARPETRARKLTGVMLPGLKAVTMEYENHRSGELDFDFVVVAADYLLAPHADPLPGAEAGPQEATSPARQKPIIHLTNHSLLS